MWYEELGIKKPYYADEWVCIVHGDCREVLPLIPDNSIDLVLTDPPYGVNHKRSGEPYMAGDNINQLPLVLPIFYRLLKDDGALFLFSSTELLRESLLAFQTYFKMHNIIIWDKKQAIFPHSQSHFNLRYEPIIYGSRGLHYLNKKRASDVIQCSTVRGNEKKHPTQKPTELVKQLLESTQENKNLILDPFLGSGTTAYCAKKLNRKCIGIEIEEKYCEIAANRCRQSVMELNV